MSQQSYRSELDYGSGQVDAQGEEQEQEEFDYGHEQGDMDQQYHQQEDCQNNDDQFVNGDDTNHGFDFAKIEKMDQNQSGEQFAFGDHANAALKVDAQMNGVQSGEEQYHAHVHKLLLDLDLLESSVKSEMMTKTENLKNLAELKLKKEQLEREMALTNAFNGSLAEQERLSEKNLDFEKMELVAAKAKDEAVLKTVVEKRRVLSEVKEQTQNASDHFRKEFNIAKDQIANRLVSWFESAADLNATDPKLELFDTFVFISIVSHYRSTSGLIRATI